MRTEVLRMSHKQPIPFERFYASTLRCGPHIGRPAHARPERADVEVYAVRVAREDLHALVCRRTHDGGRRTRENPRDLDVAHTVTGGSRFGRVGGHPPISPLRGPLFIRTTPIRNRVPKTMPACRRRRRTEAARDGRSRATPRRSRSAGCDAPARRPDRRPLVPRPRARGTLARPLRLRRRRWARAPGVRPLP
jgi:hypothetical protein